MGVPRDFIQKKYVGIMQVAEGLRGVVKETSKGKV